MAKNFEDLFRQLPAKRQKKIEKKVKKELKNQRKIEFNHLNRF